MCVGGGVTAAGASSVFTVVNARSFVAVSKQQNSGHTLLLLLLLLRAPCINTQ